MVLGCPTEYIAFQLVFDHVDKLVAHIRTDPAAWETNALRWYLMESLGWTQTEGPAERWEQAVSPKMEDRSGRLRLLLSTMRWALSAPPRTLLVDVSPELQERSFRLERLLTSAVDPLFKPYEGSWLSGHLGSDTDRLYVFDEFDEHDV